MAKLSEALRQSAANAGVTYPENRIESRAADKIDELVAALKTARTLVISYRAHEKGKHGNRREYCQSVLETIDAALAFEGGGR